MSVFTATASAFHVWTIGKSGGAPDADSYCMSCGALFATRLGCAWSEPCAQLPREEERNVITEDEKAKIRELLSGYEWSGFVPTTAAKLEPLLISFEITFGDTAVRSDDPATLKYPDKCPCGIQAADCKYHAGVKR